MVDPVAADAFRHIALLYAGPAECLLGLPGFIRVGRNNDEATLIAVPQANSQLLRQELGSESEHLTFTDMTELGRNAARIIPEILGFARRHPGRRMRCVAELGLAQDRAGQSRSWPRPPRSTSSTYPRSRPRPAPRCAATTASPENPDPGRQTRSSSAPAT